MALYQTERCMGRKGSLYPTKGPLPSYMNDETKETIMEADKFGIGRKWVIKQSVTHQTMRTNMPCFQNSMSEEDWKS